MTGRQDGSQGSGTIHDLLPRVRGEEGEVDEDTAELDRYSVVVSRQYDHPREGVVVQRPLHHLETDGVAVERFQGRGHIMIPDEKLVIGLGNRLARNPA